MQLPQKLRIFALIDAVENDLVRFMRDSVLPAADGALLTDEQAQRSRERLERRNEHGRWDLSDPSDLLYGLDLLEKLQTILRLRQFLDPEISTYFRSLHPLFEKLAPIRNDVMHGRPLMLDDYLDGFKIIQHLRSNPVFWPRLCATIANIDDHPEFLLEIDFSTQDDQDLTQYHNLPIPDHDETGFLGRRKLRTALLEAILGRPQVITVVGQGGFGKTALALQVAYDLLKRKSDLFDGIVWVTAKANTLTPTEIQRIEGAITDTAALFGAVLGEFGEKNDSLARLLQLLEYNKILLIVDNLETVLDQSIRPLAQRVPEGSKLLFTSRIPLGGSIGDKPIVVDGLSKAEARSFLMRLADVYSVAMLRQNLDRAEYYAGRLAFNPLLLKWFILGIAGGLQPERIIADPNLALKFCVENVYDHLSLGAKQIARAFAVVPGDLTLLEVEYLAELNARDIEIAILELVAFHLVDMKCGVQSEMNTFAIRGIPKAYLRRIRDADGESEVALKRRFDQLRSHAQEGLSQYAYNAYHPNAFRIVDRDDHLVANKLRAVMRSLKNDEVEEAERRLNEIRILKPSYFETYRVEAYLFYCKGDPVGAEDRYEAALSLEPAYAPLRFLYGGMLMRCGRYRDAGEQFEKGLSLEPDALPLKKEYARCLMFAGDFARCKGLLEGVKISDLPTRTDQVVFADLSCQFYIRLAEQIAHGGNVSRAVRPMQELVEYLDSIPADLVDDTMRGHVQKGIRVMDSWQSGLDEATRQIIRDIRDRIGSFCYTIAWEGVEGTGEVGEELYGRIRPRGLQESFGFIEADVGGEYFVHRSEFVSESDWQQARAGENRGIA